LTAAPKRNNIQLTMIVPVFPLPDVVLFPKTLLPLHIFEDRYRTMTREAIAGDGRIAIALLRDGWEKDYHDNPAIHKVACLGKIETYEELEGGRYNIVLVGIRRVRLVREVQQAPYRRAEIEPIIERCGDEKAVYRTNDGRKVSRRRPGPSAGFRGVGERRGIDAESSCGRQAGPSRD
jgi:Lon protease-like protein